MAPGYKTQVYKFWTDYRPDPADAAKLIGVDFVEYGPIGMAERLKITEKVSRLAKVRPRDPNDGGMDKALNEANDKWDFIRPLYEAWKAGQNLPETGTPLAAWNAVTPEQAEILKMHSVKTVEEIADMTDSGITRIPLPGMRRMVDAAKLFLKAQDQTRSAGELQRMSDENAVLRAQMDELLEMFKANDKTGELEPLEAPKKRGPGRPPKAQEDAA